MYFLKFLYVESQMKSVTIFFSILSLDFYPSKKIKSQKKKKKIKRHSIAKEILMMECFYICL